jgi:site-specific DNA recombinase
MFDPVHPTIALYCRVSTDEQAQHGFSIENQKERLIAYCVSQSWENYWLYVDDGYTGTNLDRPALQRLIQDVRNGSINTVVVYKLDRLSRKQQDVLRLLEDEFEKNNVSFKSSTEPFDTSTPLGKAMIGILAVFAQLERDTIVDRLSTGLRQRVRSGKWSGGRIPFGYDYNENTGKLETNPAQADLVRELFHRYTLGATLNELADWMASQTYERVFHHGIIRDMLGRRLYIGESAFGDTTSTEIAEPIVDEATFESVQAEMERRKEGKSPSRGYLLTGLLRCGLCDSPFIHVIRRNNRGRRKVYHLYACKNQHHRPRSGSGSPCKVGYRNQNLLEQWVIARLHSVALHPISDLRQVHQQGRLQEEQHQTAQYLRGELKKIDARLERWYDAFEAGLLGAEQLSERMNRLEKQRRSMTERLEELERTKTKLQSGGVQNDEHQLIRQAWDYMTPEEQRQVVRAAIAVIIVPPKGEDPTIVWNT